jgi:hypothetical protein
MRFLFHNDTTFNNISVYASDTRMCLERGEGEEEIANHGWSRVKVFSQETEAKSQQTSMNDEYGPKLHSKSQAQDALDSPTRLPFFSSSILVVNGRTRAAALSLKVAALRTVLVIVNFSLASSNSSSRFLIAIADLSFRCGTCAATFRESAVALVLSFIPTALIAKGSLASLAFGVFGVRALRVEMDFGGALGSMNYRGAFL